MAQPALHYTLDGKTAVLRLDDGKANGLSAGVIEALEAGLDRAEKEAAAVVLLGREGRFSGGFDLATMGSGAEAVRGLVGAGARLFLRFLRYPLPIVAGCTGHAVAAGAIVLLVADRRIGAAGDFRIGLSEVAIGMTLPAFAIEFARNRLSRRHFARATTQAEMYAPEAAVDAGYLDRVCPADALPEACRAEARRLAELAQPAFRHTKARVHSALVAAVEASLEADLGALVGGAGAR